MAQTNINIRMDADLKKQFEAFCSDIGMSMTTAFCVFAKMAVRERRIPFEITAENDPFYTDVLNNSTPIIKIRMDTTSPDTYSILPCPNG